MIVYAHITSNYFFTYNHSPLLNGLGMGISEVLHDHLNFVFCFPILFSFDNDTDQREMQRLKLPVKLIYHY